MFDDTLVAFIEGADLAGGVPPPRHPAAGKSGRHHRDPRLAVNREKAAEAVGAAPRLNLLTSRGTAGNGRSAILFEADSAAMVASLRKCSRSASRSQVCSNFLDRKRVQLFKKYTDESKWWR